MLIKIASHRLSSSTAMQRADKYRDVKTHNKLSLNDRIRVIGAYRTKQSYRQLADQFNCSTCQIRWILKDRDKIIKKYTSSKKRQVSRLHVDEKDLLLDKVVYEWFQRAQRHIETGPITNETIQSKAHEAQRYCSHHAVHINPDWVLKFRHKFDITDVDMTMLRIPNDEEPLSLDLKEITHYVLDRNPVLISSQIEGENYFHKPSMNEGGYGSILNDEQAKLYLKPLEEYVLMRENYRAIGLISQLEAIFNKSSSQ